MENARLVYVCVYWFFSSVVYEFSIAKAFSYSQLLIAAIVVWDGGETQILGISEDKWWNAVQREEGSRSECVNECHNTYLYMRIENVLENCAATEYGKSKKKKQHT